MHLREQIANALLMQRGHLFGWAPVFLGVGIGVWFSFGFEPQFIHYSALAIVMGMCLIGARYSEMLGPALLGVALISLGMLLAGYRAHSLAEPVLTFRYYGPIQGRVVTLDRSASDKVRLTLDHVVLDNMSPHRTPQKVRISLHHEQDWIAPTPGMFVMTTGHLSPPAGPVEPGGFDFKVMAWFQSLGAVGYTQNPVLQLEPPADGFDLYRFRIQISDAIRDRIDGEIGAFAAAITTGDRSAMGAETLADLRASNLAHLLAISGLHMGLLTGFVFALIRYGLALIPKISLRFSSKKIAAIAALICGAGYLALSGGNVSTERAFIMVAVMFLAILLNRRALTLRAVAIAAIIVLVRRPEQVTGPGFQMSFAATTALVAVFGGMRNMDQSKIPTWLRPVVAVFLSSLIAGLATAPYSAAHFNQISHYGLFANMLSVPVMGILVMPSAVIAACLWPFGLEFIGLWGMEIGLRWILFVANQVAHLDGSVGRIVAPNSAVLPIMTLGFLFLILWRGRSRLIGVAPVLFAGVIWAQTDRPALLVSDNGNLVGVLINGERVLSRERSDSFSARSWLENDGDARDQQHAAIAWEQRIHNIDGFRVLQIRGQRQSTSLEGCGGADILIMNVENQTDRPCDVYDPIRLRSTGSLALYQDRANIITAQSLAGNRIWNTPSINPSMASDYFSTSE
ncbi:ComEC/Rec2 family competence protein [Aestuariibius sp. HNIBRBA575]|uniref:ComEC/Rec2 family competence protein n=1 Tax=Aestuariibius sp. HNIBRBA575 TaxID=3233343 RepID=UPI0034A38C27